MLPLILFIAHTISNIYSNEHNLLKMDYTQILYNVPKNITVYNNGTISTNSTIIESVESDSDSDNKKIIGFYIFVFSFGLLVFCFCVCTSNKKKQNTNVRNPLNIV